MTLSNDPPPTPLDALQIVMVCEGNICRSPLAEVLTRSRLGEAGLHRAVSVSSAGLGAVVGAPMDATAAEMARHYRGLPDDFRARQLDSSIVNSADLLLTMTRAQRDDLVHRFPRALQRTFTLTEFSKLLATQSLDFPELSALDESTEKHVAASLTSHSPDIARMLRERTRGFSRIRSKARLTPDDDVADPFRRPTAFHEAVAQKISLATSQIVHNFVGWAIDSEGIDSLRP